MPSDDAARAVLADIAEMAANEPDRGEDILRMIEKVKKMAINRDAKDEGWGG